MPPRHGLWAPSGRGGHTQGADALLQQYTWQLLLLVTLLLQQRPEYRAHATRVSREVVANVTLHEGVTNGSNALALPELPRVALPPVSQLLQELVPEDVQRDLLQSYIRDNLTLDDISFNLTSGVVSLPGDESVDAASLLNHVADRVENAGILPEIVPSKTLRRIQDALTALGDPAKSDCPLPVLDVGLLIDPEAQIQFASQSLGITFPLIANISTVFRIKAGPWAIDQLSLLLSYTPLRPVIQGEQLEVETQNEELTLIPVPGDDSDVRTRVANFLRAIAGVLYAAFIGEGDGALQVDIPGDASDLSRALPMNVSLRTTPYLQSSSYTYSQLQKTMYFNDADDLESLLELSLRASPNDLLTVRNVYVQTEESFLEYLAALSAGSMQARSLSLSVLCTSAVSISLLLLVGEL